MSDYKQELFNYMAQDHGVTLLEQDIHEIESIVSKPLKAEIQSLKQELAECQELLKERDGGDHDADCKVYKGRSCNCVHDSVAEYFNPPRHNQR